MKLRNGKNTTECFSIQNNWWFRYTKEHYRKFVKDGDMFNKNIYGKHTIEEWITIILPDFIETEKFIRHHAKKV